MGHRVGVGATSEHLVSGLQLEHDQLSEIGLHSGSSNRKLSATMKPDLDGRTVLGLQPRHKALSETYREKSSDLALHLRKVPYVVSRKRSVVSRKNTHHGFLRAYCTPSTVSSRPREITEA